jgi:hypothetical protein
MLLAFAKENCLADPVTEPRYMSILFENQADQMQQAIKDEIQRVASGDPRLFLNDIQVFPQNNGILIQLEITIVQTTEAKILAIFFDAQQQTAGYV